MTNETLVHIEKFKQLCEDERGITSEFSLPTPRENFIFITRKSGTVSGNTYHEGKNPTTHPKIFLLLSGEIIFSYRKVKETNVFTELVHAPAMIKVFSYVTHQIEVINDAIILECNSVMDIQNDRIKEAVY